MEQKLIPVRDYTKETFSSIMATKNPLAKIITPYWSWNLELEKQLQEMTGRADLKLPDFLAFAVQKAFNLGMETKHIGREWNLAPSIRARIGLPEPQEAESVVTEAISKPVSQAVADISAFKPQLPLKSTTEQIGTLGIVKSKSVESEASDMKATLEALLKKFK